MVEENLTADYADNTDRDGSREARFYRRGREGRRETVTLRQSLPIQATTALNELVLLEQPEENLTADYADSTDQNGSLAKTNLS